MIGCAVDVPVLACEGRCAIEEVLTVVEIEDREMAVGLFVVACGEIDDQVALVAKETRAELVVFAELA